MESGHYCSNIGGTRAPRKERPRKPPPPHLYLPCQVSGYGVDGVVVRCQVRDCQDERHRVLGALGVIQ